MLFTRCPDCETTFRITADALRKANGQVRCGRCARVFNAYNELRRRARRKVAAMREEAVAAGAATLANGERAAHVANAENIEHLANAENATHLGNAENAAHVANAERLSSATSPAQSANPTSGPQSTSATSGPQSADVASAARAAHAEAAPRGVHASGTPRIAPAPDGTASRAAAWEADARPPSGASGARKPSADDTAARTATVVDVPARTRSPSKKVGQKAKAAKGEKDLAIGDISLASVIAELAASAAPEDADTPAGASRGVPDKALPSGTLLEKNGLASMADAVPTRSDAQSPPAPSWAIVDDAASRRAPSRAWAIGSIAAAVLLALQLVHHYRNELAVLAVVGPAVRHAYALLGAEIAPNWDLDQYEIVVDWDAVTQPGDTEDNRLTIAARIRNKGPSPVPLPHVQVQIKDRWESTLGSRVFTPAQYLPPGAAVDRAMIAGQIALAKLAILDPGPQAYGFELDVCVDAKGGALRCAADEVFR